MKLKVPNKYPGGFTLVELLLGLVIAAIIGVTVYNMFWSAMKLDDRMRHVHDNYMELLMADQAMTQDLENAINLDFSASYPDAAIFEGQKTEFSFITQTPGGLKRVSYFSGMPDDAGLRKAMIGRVTNPSAATGQSGPSPVEFLLRQESSLADWLNETADNTSTQIVASGLKKGSFNCQYAPFAKNLHMTGAQGITYSDTWDEKSLPLAVSCNFTLWDPKKTEGGLIFKRDIFLAPLPDYQNEQ